MLIVMLLHCRCLDEGSNQQTGVSTFCTVSVSDPDSDCCKKMMCDTCSHENNCLAKACAIQINGLNFALLESQ